ncbi:hypothetical protein ACF065_25940 [Streptomyces sp. NPDC015232]|uniref:hypothetical protein n=1 Tax=unclassified Streptomyces TaxID=2593676 RepID=UPI0036F50A1B
MDLETWRTVGTIALAASGPAAAFAAVWATRSAAGKASAGAIAAAEKTAAAAITAAEKAATAATESADRSASAAVVAVQTTVRDRRTQRVEDACAALITHMEDLCALLDTGVFRRVGQDMFVRPEYEVGRSGRAAPLALDDRVHQTCKAAALVYLYARSDRLKDVALACRGAARRLQEGCHGHPWPARTHATDDGHERDLAVPDPVFQLVEDVIRTTDELIQVARADLTDHCPATRHRA